MNKLPPELQLTIFRYLPVKDTIRLQIVCKRWRELFNCLRHESLNLFDKNNYEGGLYHLKPFESNDLIELNEELLLRSPKLRPMLSNIKKLTAYFYSDSIVDLSQFYNQFTKLEELECYHHTNLIKKIILNLPNLTKLIISNYLDCANYELDLPSLTFIKVSKLSSCELHYPERLKRIDSNLFDYDRIDFTKFTNLEFLNITGEEWQLITNSLLETLAKLKCVHFLADTFLSRETLNSNFNYRRNDLNFYLFGFDIDKDVQINEEDEDFTRSETNTSKFIIRNYEKTADTVYYEFKIDYNELIKTNGLPKGFLKKFPKLSLVKTIDRLENEDALLDFLKSTQPDAFFIENQLLSQSFLNQLAFQCTFIKKLHLKNLNSTNILSKDFDFIFKMTNLNEINIWQEIAIGFLIKAFENLVNLCEVFISIDETKDARFCSYYIDLSIQIETLEDEFYFLESFLYLENKYELIYILKDIQNELCSFNQFIEIRKLVFLINNYKFLKFVNDEMIRKLFHLDTILIYSLKS